MHFISQYKGLRKENYILFFGRIVTNLGGMVWPVLTLILNQKMGFSATGVALVMLIFSLIMLPVTMIGGRLADKCNKKYVIIVCDLISVIFYITCAFIDLSYFSLALIMIGAACQNMEYPSYNALIADITPTKDRERAYSMQYLGANIGLVVSPTIAGILFNHYLWLSFLLSGVFIFMSTTLIFFKLKDISPVEESHSEAGAYQTGKSDQSLISILKSNKVLILYILVMGLYQAAYNQYGYLMPLDMARIHGQQGSVIFGSISSLNCILVVIFTPVITRVFRKVVSPKKTFIGISLLFIGYLLNLLMMGHIPIYYIAISLFTFGEMFSTIADGPYLSSRIPSSHRGRINGLNTVVSGFLQNACMIAIGILYDVFNYKVVWSLVLIVLVVALALTSLLIIVDRRAYRDLYTDAKGL